MIDYRRFTFALAASVLVATVITATAAMDHRAYLPLVQSPFTAPRELPHPAGIDCFEKAAPIAEDRAGRLFVTCQATNGNGQVVWYVEGNAAHVVFTGKADYAGPGIFGTLRSGQLVLSTVGKLNSDTTWLIPIDGWTP